VTLPRWLAAFNRTATNRLTGRFAARLPGFGVIIHRGRRSGRSYRTPVNVFRTRDGYVVALTYGPDGDWVRNVTAAGGCDLETRGRRLSLGSPQIVHDPSRAVAPPAVRAVLRALGVTDFLTLALVPPAGR
jgi:deazaflavin-dependent oxidoreductase (nitroreductase family)